MLYEDGELMTLAMTRIGRMTRAVAPSGPSVGPRAKTEAKKLGLRPMEHPGVPALLFHHSSSDLANMKQKKFCHSCCPYGSGALIRITFDPKTEK